MEKVQNYIKDNKERFLNELMDLLRIPSVSADPAYAGDVQKTAQLVAKQLKAAGCRKVKINKTKGHPIVTGERMVDKKLPTVLVYGHYDVQPADPIELWDSPPFEPVIKKTKLHKNGAIFARGACDDKGQMYMHVKALEAMTKSRSLPCNVKFMIEGEEEVGSDNLEPFIKKNKAALKCDVVLVSDTSIIDNKTPSICTGLRGLSYLEVEVTGANRDLHSGVYGGAVANPLNVLSDMISSLKGKNGKIRIPNFYDDVLELTKAERAALNEAPFNINSYKRELKIADTMGERGFTVLEQTSIRPTLDVNGMWGGYTGEGAKTVLPSKAYAKISMRLVPNQDPKKITKLFTQHFKSLAPKGVKVVVKPHHGGKPAVTPTDTVEYKAAALAMEKAFGKAPIPQRSGGSIPIVSLFEDILKVKTILMGFGLDTDDIHSPNEHYGVDNYYKGIETIPYFYEYYTALKAGKEVQLEEVAAVAKPAARRGRPAKKATTEAAKPAAKRRGRPRKTETAEVKPVAKRRGRPAKKATTAAKPATTAKKGPGRPKKATTAAKPATTAKKGPGRPRKATTAAKPATTAKKGPGRPKKAATAAKPATTAKKGPGRPRKATTAAKPATTAKKGPGRPKKATTAAKPATTAKKGPGRPKKATTAAKPATTAKKGPGRPRKATTAAKPATTAKKGPGRPKKAATAAKPATTAKKGSGRPKKAATAAKPATTAKKGPGRPKEAATAAKPATTAKKGPGRPKKAATAAKPATTAKKGPGRPKKAATAVKPSTTAKKGPGRPRKVAAPVKPAATEKAVTEETKKP